MNILEDVGEYDFYHLPGYQRLCEPQLEGRAVLPIFRHEGYSMAFPLLIRDIAIQGVINGYRDAACVPGLTGPVISDIGMPDEVRHNLMRQFQDFLRDNRFVSIYSRLHFLLGQEAFLSGYGELVEDGVEVTLDLAVPLEEQASRYRRNLRRDLKTLESMNLVFEEVGSEYLDVFMSLYYATMDRVGATHLYYNDKSYFAGLLNDMSQYTRVFLCRDGETVACALFVLLCKEHVHAYRIGTFDEYRDLSVSKWVYDGLRIWATKAGAKVFHFGGGARGSRDSLYQFKMGFGGREHVCCTWRYIADQEVYDDLCRQAFALAGKTPDDTYFPEYRSPSLGLGQGARS